MIVALLLTLLPSVAARSAEPPSYTPMPFTLPAETRKLAAADMNGDGLGDLVAVLPGRFRVYLQGPDGFDFSRPSAELTVAGRSVGWDIVDLNGSGTSSVVALVDGKDVKTWPFSTTEQRFGDPRLLHGGVAAVVPGGFYHLSFLRDVDRDGNLDLVIPGNGAFHIYTRAPDGSYRRGPSVIAQVRMRQDLDGDGDLNTTIGQSLTVPLCDIRDLNGDGHADLYSETEDLLEVYLASDDGVLPHAPTYTFDIAAARKKLGPVHGEDMDMSNIMAPATRTVQLLSKDVNGDGAEDLLFRSGGKVDLYLASATGVDTSKVSQRLKASGNVFAIAADDEDGDGKPDLWIFRLETVSLAGAMMWLVAPGSIDIDILVYRFQEKGFARRPTRRIKLTLKFPALLSLMSEMNEIRVDLVKRLQVPAHKADLSGAGQARDVVVIENATLRGYLDKVDTTQASLPEAGGFFNTLLELEDYSRDKNEYVIELDKIADLIPTPGAELVEAVRGARPDLEVPLPQAGDEPALFLLDLNGDRRDDLLVIFERDDEKLTGAVVLSRLAR